ncbi:Mpv17 / PMP22 family [Seminavis robusta]|uniref:Mpv17 / PMP22 family n=1 Tax=Seminavis robusta TaxID=568900 RepID=A0A9N8E8C5_9STRA|nr:Mpv17 / PMP22 family [Seminavis robusta]|eukprot:Sro781_g201650.1 Mpv17 / PMP22 family (687) ;mRNA; r:37487-39547
MRMLPIPRASIRRPSNDVKSDKPEDHRRSWHVGTTTSTGNHRRSNGAFRKTWHFHRTSSHTHPNNSEESGDPEPPHDDANRVNIGTEEERKTFSYASHVTAENETAAPCPPPDNAKNVAVVSDGQQGQTQQNSAGIATTNATQEPLRRSSKKRGWFKRAKTKTGRVIHAIEDFLFPGCRPLHGSSTAGSHRRSAQRSMSPGAATRIPPEQIEETLEIARTMYGQEGLRAAGFEFRRVECAEHRQTVVANKENDDHPEDTTTTAKSEEQGGDDDDDEVEGSNSGVAAVNHGQDSQGNNLEGQHALQAEQQQQSKQDEEENEKEINNNAAMHSNKIVLEHPPKYFCRQCCNSLFHIASNTQIDKENRKQFIADGAMYDAVARLCQENAQEVMMKQYGLVWVTVCEGQEEQGHCPHPHLKQGKHEPIRALVNAEHPLAQQQRQLYEAGNNNNKGTQEQNLEHYSNRPTLLVATGKGKVRAGIFSRQHLMVSGMECSTSLPLVHEARKRDLNIVLVDPNAHGDRLGMVTFEKSMTKLFPSPCHEKNPDVYVLSHSASGSHFVRHILDGKFQQPLRHIRAIAFTDSTHNIQWPRQKGNQELVHLLESDTSIYFRCATAGTSENWSLHHAGQEASTDQFWRHRFGMVKTCWAGTKEHSLTNWFALTFIWEHFDRFLNPEEDQRCQKIGADNE